MNKLIRKALAMTVSLEASQFYPGNHLPGMKTAEWLRFQTILRF